MSVAISWANKMEWAQCDNSVGFPKSSHVLYIKPYESMAVNPFLNTLEVV